MEFDDRKQWGGSSSGDDQPIGFGTRSERFGSGYPSERFGSGYPYERSGFGYPYERFGFGRPYERFGFGYRSAQFGYGGFDEMDRGEHIWRGGVLGWLGAGIRAGAGWFGSRLQQWGSWFGGRVSGQTAEIGRAVRGRGERVASALEEQDERTAGTFRRNQSSRYRRPDERILDDVWHRISLAAVDPQDVEVEVNAGVVTLSGRVSTRYEKRVLEDIADSVFGVQEVHNHLRLARSASEASSSTANTGGVASQQRSFDQNAAQPERH